MPDAPSFPPLLTGVECARAPFVHAQSLAARGCDGGTVVWAPPGDRIEAAIVFAPEVPLEDACAMLVVCGIGLVNALGALAPPEVPVHLGWSGEVRVNGGLCGGLRLAASTTDPEAEPDWLVVGLTLTRLPPDTERTGDSPDTTSLWAEGCGELDPILLIEAWARHSLVWINRWSEEGLRPVHAEWRGLAWGLGDDTPEGTFLGVDDRFGKLVKSGQITHTLPLSSLLETP